MAASDVPIIHGWCHAVCAPPRTHQPPWPAPERGPDARRLTLRQRRLMPPPPAPQGQRSGAGQARAQIAGGHSNGSFRACQVAVPDERVLILAPMPHGKMRRQRVPPVHGTPDAQRQARHPLPRRTAARQS